MLGRPSPFPGGFCSLAVSPDEPNVVFVIFGNPILFGDLFLGRAGEFFEGHIDESTVPPSVTWTGIPYPDPQRKQRVPFVATNKRAQGFDLWLGDGSVWRIPCTAATTPSCTTDKTQWSGSFTDDQASIQAAHGDSGTIVFDSTQSIDASPTLYSSDGGVYLNSSSASPACQDPDFRGANVGLHAFLLWGMDSVTRAGAEAEDLYFGTQDNGLYFTVNAGAPAPSWAHGIGADVFDIVADPTRVVVTNGGLLAGDAGLSALMSGGGKFALLPADPGDGIMPYPQPILVAFDPMDPDILIAAGMY